MFGWRSCCDDDAWPPCCVPDVAILLSLFDRAVVFLKCSYAVDVIIVRMDDDLLVIW